MGKNKSVISFVTNMPGLLDIEECLPIPARKAFPSWISQIPRTDPIFNGETVRKCPGIIDYLSQGYVLPMWTDVRLNYESESETWTAFSGRDGRTALWESHGNHQFLDHVRAGYFGRDAKFVFKAVSPWKIITPPGWSVLQLPLTYHFDNQFSIMPGVIDTDMYYELNQQVLYFGDSEDVVIPRGTPLVLYVPFKRESLDLEIRVANESDGKRFASADTQTVTKFLGSGFYRKMQKARDEKKSNGRSRWRTK
jgi:hypothetical protein